MRGAAFLLIGLALRAQIQITASDLPSAGESFVVSQSRPRLGIDFLATGENFTWDFGQLTADTQFVIDWKSPLQVPQYILSCGNASFQAIFLKVSDSISAPVFTLKDIYASLRKGSQQMSVQGFGASLNGMPITECYQDPDEIYLLPLSYGREDSTTFWLRVTIPLPNLGTFTLAQRGYRLHKVDGYGQLTTPYGTFQVLRLQKEIHRRDTLYVDNMPLRRSDTTFLELEWLGREQGIPLLRVEGIPRRIGSTQSILPTSIQFKDEGRNAAIFIEHGEKLSITPNPSRGILHVPAPGARYTIYNLIGRVVSEGYIPSDAVLRLPEHLPEGIYFLKLMRGDREYWHRFSLVW